MPRHRMYVLSLTDKQISFLQEIIAEKRSQIHELGHLPNENWIAIKGIGTALSRAVHGAAKRQEHGF